ncbi:hypothetical protein [Pseudomonas sp. H2_D02]
MSWIDMAFSLMAQAWLGTVIGIVSLIVAAVTYLWTRKRTSLGYVHLGEHVLGSASDSLPSAIVVQYNGVNIPRLTKSVVIFWNSGENTVLGADIVATDPLRFQIGDDGQILSISVLKASRSVNDFTILPSPTETHKAAFNFNFLDANDGVVVEILHTSTDRKPRISGTLRGLPQGVRNFGQFKRPKPRKIKRMGPLPALIPFVFLCACFAIAFYVPRPEFISASAFNGLMGMLGGFWGMWTVDCWATRRKYPKSLYVDALE